MRIRKPFLLSILLVIAVSANGHDLFLKLDSYFITPNSVAVIRLMNGTFEKSEGVVAHDRFRDISILAPDLRKPVSDSVSWQEYKQIAIMTVQTGGEGTYVVGISTNPKEISLKAASFNKYLEHDGIPDILEARKSRDELDKDVRERYSKHVRAIFQVGTKLSDDYNRPLNYPVEIIPLQNPYALKIGQTLGVICLSEGQPLANQFVIVGREKIDGQLETINLRTNALGMTSFKLTGPGKWYVKLIRMVPLSDSGSDYESLWATLTFEMRAKPIRK